MPAKSSSAAAGGMSKHNTMEQVAAEKISYMRDYAKSSTLATIGAPLLCIPLYDSQGSGLLFHAWLVLMAIAVCIRIYLIKSTYTDTSPRLQFLKLNWAVGIVTFVWGIGWFMLVPNMELANYLIYQIISLSVLFVGMVGYCVNWKTFYSFVLPLKLPEFVFILFHYKFVVWPIAVGSMWILYLALRMGMLFAKSWEKSIALRYRNDQLFEQLTVEKDASVAANVAKSEFISTASHDLRQPMQAINIFVELINIENLAAKERSIFQKMRASIAVLNKMFNTLLDNSKLDSNANPVYTNFDLSAVVSELAVTFSPLAAEKGLALHFHGEKYGVQGDKNLLDQMLRNLLANAIQYTSQGGVDVYFKSEADQLLIEVRDTGCGIPSEDLPYIYKEFFRSQNARAQHDGLGLGLSIVSRIVQKLGGSLAVETEPDVGSVFKITTRFPLLGAQALAKPASEPQAYAWTATSPAHASLKHLGIIEDDKSLMYAYSSYFTSVGYQVHCIPHHEDEFKAALLGIPQLDFILSDYRLGDKHGTSFIQNLREEFNENIPACIVTADTSPQHLNLFRELNIEVLYKPIDIHSISKYIENRLA